MGSSKRKRFSELNPKLQSIICFALAFLVSMFVFKTILLIGYVPSASMEPTLKTDSVCLGLRIFDVNDCKVGDVIIFEHESGVLVKRIAAVGGEKITADTGVSFNVPKDHFFMLGDNKDNSYDSRYWEDPFVNEDDVLAKVILPR